MAMYRDFVAMKSGGIVESPTALLIWAYASPDASAVDARLAGLVEK